MGVSSNERILGRPHVLGIALLAVSLAIGIVLFVRVSSVEAVCNGSIAYGDVFDCSISVADEEDTFTFNGTSGDTVLFRMREVSSALWPEIVVKRPDGTQLCTNWAGDEVEQECTLDVTGTWTLIATSNNASIGDYRLYVARTSTPTTETPTAISYGDVTAGTLNAMHWDPYTFSGTSGEKVLVRLRETTSGLWPEMRLRRPDGTQLCYNWSGSEVERDHHHGALERGRSRRRPRRPAARERRRGRSPTCQPGWIARRNRAVTSPRQQDPGCSNQDSGGQRGRLPASAVLRSGRSS